MGKLKLIVDNISTVEDLYNGLAKLPMNTGLSPFGSSDCQLIYDEENKVAYIDEEFSYLGEDYTDLINDIVEKRLENK
jgi:hypothetical protein